MRHIRLISLLTLLVIFNFSACEEGADASCHSANDIVHTIENGEASLSTDPDSGVRILRYHVPGTIDSIYTGIICDEDFPDFQVAEGFLSVIFSGHFLDDEGQIQFTVATGGEEFFYLNLTAIVQKGQ